MQSMSLAHLSWQQFSHSFKFIKSFSLQSSLNSPYSLYLHLQSKQKYLIKQITFENAQELQIIIEQLQNTNRTYKLNQKSFFCQMTAFCIKFQASKETRNVHSHQTIFAKKEGKILFIFQHFMTLQQIIQSLIMSPNDRSFIEGQSDIVTLNKFPSSISAISQKTLKNILKTLVDTVYFVKQYGIDFIKSFTFQMIQIQKYGQIDEKSKFFFYSFPEKDIVEMIWKEKLPIENSFVGKKVLQLINQKESNQFTKINFNYEQNIKLSQLKRQISQTQNFQVLNEQDILQSLCQSIGLILLKGISLCLGKQRFLEVKFYKMDKNYQLAFNSQTIQQLITEIKKNNTYSAKFISVIQVLIFQNEKSQITLQNLKQILLFPQKNVSPFDQKKTFAKGKNITKNKKFIDTSFSLTPPTKIGIEINKLTNNSSNFPIHSINQKKSNRNSHPKSKSRSNSRSNSNIQEKSKLMNPISKHKQFSPSIKQKDMNFQSKKQFLLYQHTNLNVNSSVKNEVNLNSERKNFIQTLKKKILYNPNTGLLHQNIISKQFRDGSTYLGQYNPARNIKEGYGLYFYFDGDIYGGTWKNDQLNGLGIYCFANGDSYEGGVVNGQKDGYGVYHYGNGNIYKGYWKNDKKQGKGQFSYANGDFYNGQFVQGRKQGHGIYKWTNGDVYEGKFSRNMKNGLGKFKKLLSQNTIEGIWENDFIIDKQGVIITYGKSDKFYQGQILEDGIINGFGKYVFQKNGYYEGQFRSNHFSGKCTIHFNNGDVFTGQVLNDLFQGYGEYYHMEKNMKYIGFWLRGKQNGKGKLIFMNQGTTLQTIWQNGCYGQHKGVINYGDGSRYEGEINENGRHGKGKYFYSDGKWVDAYFQSNRILHIHEISE